jgi:hypothetical protein
MTDRVQGREIGKVAAVPRPPRARSEAPAQPFALQAPGVALQASGQPITLQRPGTCRAAVRDALDAAVHGIRLTGRDRQFLGRLVHWDKRNAGAVASLLWRARIAGRDEAALSGRQLEIVLGALGDAAAYRSSGADAAGCWDCENIPGGRCADHARDSDRARACAELAAQLASGSMAGSAAGPGGGDFQPPTRLTGFRRQASPVAS